MQSLPMPTLLMLFNHQDMFNQSLLLLLLKNKHVRQYIKLIEQSKKKKRLYTKAQVMYHGHQ